MPIDPSIALSVRAPQVEDPLSQYGRALSLKQLMQQGQQQDQQIQRQEAVRQILRQSRGNITPEVLREIATVDHAAAFAIQEQMDKGRQADANLQKTEGDIAKNEQALTKEDLEAWAGIASGITNDETKAGAIGTALQRKLRGVPREKLIELLETPYEQAKPIIEQFKTQVTTAAQRMQAEQAAATAKQAGERDAATAEYRKKDLAIRQQQADTSARPNTPTELAMLANDPKASAEDRKKASDAMDALERHAKASRTVIGTAGTGTQDNIKSTAQGITEGRLPPPDVSSRPTQYSLALTGELQRMGYDLTKASRDWKAVQKHMSSMNGAQQLRLRQAVDAVFQHTDLIESLYDEWKKVGKPSGFKILNKANLALAKQLPGRAGEVAQGLEAQVNDLISELGTAYKGGNASTDETLRLAQENLKADWNEQQFSRALKLIKQNMQIRKNSIESTQPSGVSQNSPYVPEMKAQPHGPAASGPQIGQVVKLRNGKSVKITVVHPDGTFDGDEVK